MANESKIRERWMFSAFRFIVSSAGLRPWNNWVNWAIIIMLLFITSGILAVQVMKSDLSRAVGVRYETKKHPDVPLVGKAWRALQGHMVVVHPLDDDVKHDVSGLGRIPMTMAVT